jgi:hypothetical protein
VDGMTDKPEYAKWYNYQLKAFDDGYCISAYTTDDKTELYQYKDVFYRIPAGSCTRYDLPNIKFKACKLEDVRKVGKESRWGEK